MSERTIALSEAQACAAHLFSVGTIELLDKKYGTGYPHFAGGITPKPYHNLYHGRRVRDNTALLGSIVQLTPAEIMIGALAGEAHDAIQELGVGANEEASAERFERELHKEFGGYLVEMGGLAILGTEPRFNEARMLTHQRVIEMDFPSRQAEKLARSLTSADIGDAFLPQGPHDAHRLFQELKGKHPDEEPPRAGFVEFLLAQAQMTENFVLPLEAANTVFCKHRNAVIRYAHKVAEQAANNKIETFNQLFRQDIDFARQLSNQ